MKKKTGFADRNDNEICVGDKVHIYPSCSCMTPYLSMTNGYEGIVTVMKELSKKIMIKKKTGIESFIIPGMRLSHGNATLNEKNL